MPRNQEVIEARIAAKVARLRLLAAWTAVAVFNRDAPPPTLDECGSVASELNFRRPDR
jgi:hypothetical protein